MCLEIDYQTYFVFPKAVLSCEMLVFVLRLCMQYCISLFDHFVVSLLLLILFLVVVVVEVEVVMMMIMMMIMVVMLCLRGYTLFYLYSYLVMCSIVYSLEGPFRCLMLNRLVLLAVVFVAVQTMVVLPRVV